MHFWLPFLAVGWALGLLGAPLLAQQLVTTPDGQRVRLELHWVGPPYAPPNSSPVPVEKYTYYLSPTGERIIHGRFSLSYRNGKRVEYTTYVHGEKEGPFATLSAQLELQATGTYRSGELHGEVTWYYPAGTVRKREVYVAGVLHGPYLTYYVDGTRQEESSLDDGLKQGPVVWYHANGQVASRGTYRNGFLSGQYVLYDTTGRKRAEGRLEKEWVIGAWHCFAADGQVVAVREDCGERFYAECSCP